MPSTLSDDPLLYGLEMSLSNTLKIALFRSSNCFLEFFLKQKTLMANLGEVAITIVQVAGILKWKQNICRKVTFT